MDISIIIVNYNSSRVLKNCLRSIFASQLNIEYEVIIVDNNSSNNSVQIIKDNFEKVILIENLQNLGFAKASNIGIEKSIGKYILFLNPDTLVHSDTIIKLYQFLRANKEYGAVGPKIYLPDGTIQLEGGRNFPSLRYILFEIFVLRRTFPVLFGGLRFENWDHNTSRDVPCLSGAAMMFSRIIIKKVGLLDVSLPMYLEDIDYCYRIRQAGSKIYYLNDVSIIHFCGQSSSQMLNNARLKLYVMELCQANYLFFKKHYGKLYPQVYRIVVFLGSSFRIVLILLGSSALKLFGKSVKDFSIITLKKYIEFLKWSVLLKVNFPDEALKKYG